jgi:signal transduction histidine kinase
VQRFAKEADMASDPAIESIPLRREPVDVGVLVEMATDVMQRQARSLGIALAIHVDIGVPERLLLDRDKVAWVVTSLVGSALRHVRTPGGSIAVDVAYDDARSRVSVEVRDDGLGIPAHTLSRLLNRDGWHPGAALALLLVEDIAIAHGGNLHIESKNDRSEHFTKICFTIPVR